jgi:hypothetical protein
MWKASREAHDAALRLRDRKLAVEKIGEESTHFKAADGSAAYFQYWRSLLLVLKKFTYG